MTPINMVQQLRDEIAVGSKQLYHQEAILGRTSGTCCMCGYRSEELLKRMDEIIYEMITDMTDIPML